MKILLTGSTGFIGSHLVAKFMERGFHQWVFLTRNPERLKKIFTFPAQIYAWDPTTQTPPPEAFQGVSAIIHLAGESIAGGRWNESEKKKIYASRIRGTQNLLKGVSQSSQSMTILSASAVGYYGNRQQEILDESSSPGNRDYFLSHVCQDWEAALFSPPLSSPQFRRVALRFGLVLSPDGGALKTMLPAFQLGLAGRLGNGKQFMSWIHLDDLLNLILWVLQNPQADGVYNAVSPHPITNTDFTQTMGEILHRPTLIPAPAPLLKLILGESSHLLLDGQRVIPKRALEQGFQFHYPHLKEALDNLLVPLRGRKSFLLGS